MTPLYADFVPRPSVGAGVKLLVVGVWLAALLAGYWAYQEYRTLNLERARVRARAVDTGVERVPKARQNQDKELPAYYAEAHGIVRMSQFPVQALLEGLEGTHVRGARVEQIDMQADRGVATVELSADSVARGVEYVSELNKRQADGMSEWAIQSTQPAPGGSVASAGSSAVKVVVAWGSIH